MKFIVIENAGTDYQCDVFGPATRKECLDYVKHQYDVDEHHDLGVDIIREDGSTEF